MPIGRYGTLATKNLYVHTGLTIGQSVDINGTSGNVTTTGIITSTNVTSATSTVTGAMRVAGGVGIGGDLWVGGTVYGAAIFGAISSATNSVNSTNIATTARAETSTHFVTFVDSNNTSTNNEAVYTTSSFVIVPSSGNVGVGTSSPLYKLEVNGTFAATSKSFVIDHPTKLGKKLVYGSLESPYHGVRLTGRASIKDKKIVVSLPDYICGLCHSEGSQIQITNIRHDKILWVESIDIENSTFTVACNRRFYDKKEYEFFWSFTGIRKDIDPLQTEI